MIRHHGAWLSLVVILISCAALTLAACSGPTAAPAQAPAGSEGQAPAGVAGKDYPAPTEFVPTAPPEGYVKPSEVTPTAESYLAPTEVMTGTGTVTDSMLSAPGAGAPTAKP